MKLTRIEFLSILWLENISYCEKLKELTLIVTKTIIYHLNRVTNDNASKKIINLAKTKRQTWKQTIKVKTHNVKKRYTQTFN